MRAVAQNTQAILQPTWWRGKRFGDPFSISMDTDSMRWLIPEFEEVLDRPVGGRSLAHLAQLREAMFGRQPHSEAKRQIAQLLDRSNSPLIETVGELSASIGGLAQAAEEFLEFFGAEIVQARVHSGLAIT